MISPHKKTMKIPIRTNAGIFVLEMSDKGLYAVRFPTGSGSFSGKMSLARLFRKFREARLDLSGYTPFQLKVYAALRKIPPGMTVSYGELAKRAGYPGAARAVGTAMRKNRLPIVIPCHRVIPVTGGLGEYSAGKKWKRFLLKCEVSGVKVSECQKCKVTR